MIRFEVTLAFQADGQAKQAAAMPAARVRRFRSVSQVLFS